MAEEEDGLGPPEQDLERRSWEVEEVEGVVTVGELFWMPARRSRRHDAQKPVMGLVVGWRWQVERRWLWCWWWGWTVMA